MVGSISSAGSVNSYSISQLQKRQQPSAEDLLNKIDTDGDGSVSQDEFISSRPEDVSADQAQQMWSRLDADGAGSLTGSQFVSAMENMAPPQGPPPQDSGESASGVSALSTDSESDGSSQLIKALLNAIKQYTASTEQTSSTATDDDLTLSATTGQNQSLSELFGKIDTDGDGSVSQDEFISSRPEDISEDQAKQMWDELDTESSGSLSQDQFVSAMAKQGPPPGPPPGGIEASESTDSTSTASTTTASDELVSALLKAIKEYTISNQNGLYSAASMAIAGSLSTSA